MYAEEELAIALRKGSEGAPPNAGRLEQVVRRGRSIRRRRGAVAAAGLAAVMATGLVAYGGGGAGAPADDAVPVAVRLPLKLGLPAAQGGIVTGSLPLVTSVQRQRMGETALVRFAALSDYTLFNVRCAVPNSWVFTEGPGTQGSVGRCGPGDGVFQMDRGVGGPHWIGNTHTLRVWVLPPQAIVKDGTAPQDAPAIAARTGVWEGAWAVGVYDRRV
ncbi:hypothetical protein [Actinomadura roseirufa]|uniref:hypothetical protein n=1 Tax=Actinomadura roseirufa TaxID=2094049 RepID=UPI001040EB36|nr:hypothetical protein [Actinomadura roseirufa]